MNAPILSLSRRLRQTPFTPMVETAGVKGYTVYNRMLLPSVFESLEADYHHLKRHVQLWDVACERQVALVGRDAARLVQLMTPRNMAKMAEDQCFYLAVVDDQGGMLNDPVALRVEQDCWWISIADSDFLYWAKGLATGLGLDVKVYEPDVSPLAVQGPRADQLMAQLFGDVVRDIRFFRYKKLEFAGHTFVVARSGYSKQGGYEIYVEGAHRAPLLWEALWEAGQALEVRAGCPNAIERIEGGLLSYGNDMTLDNTPFECGLGKFCDLDDDIDCIGKAALQAKRDPAQCICPIEIDADGFVPPRRAWPLYKDDLQVGQITSAAWSPDYQTVVAIGMVQCAHWQAGNSLMVETPNGLRQAKITSGFWQ